MAKGSIESFSTRVVVLIGLMSLCFMVLAVRLYYLQVYKRDHYTMLSDKNRIQTTPIKPQRGKILDRHGAVLALNKPKYHAVLDRRKNKNLSETLEKVSQLITLSEEESEALIEKADKIPKYIPLEIKRNLSWEELSILEINSFTIPGLEVIKSDERFYPHNKSLSHVLGYVSKPNQEEVSKNILLSVPGVVIGKSGIERSYDEDLRGDFGQLETENNALGQKIRTLSKEPSLPGEDISLTIDLPLQNHIYDVLKDYKSAAAIVMDVHTGEILALVSIPGFDPNVFTKGISSKDWQELLREESHPLVNKVISGLYSPGSLIKVFIAYALLKNPHIGSTYKVGCDGKYPVGSHTFHCWNKGGHGSTNLLKAIVQSCDIFFYKATQLLGIEKLIQTLSDFKFGHLIGIDLDPEKSGLLPSPEWKRKLYQQPWWLGDTINLSIGQGALLATPLQWVYAISMIANGGHDIQPHLRKSDTIAPQHTKITEDNTQFLQKALDQTVNSSSGTGRRARLNIADFRIVGKTSTSQVKRITLKERQQGIRSVNDTPWHLRDNAIFTGYAPAHNPKYALALIIEHGGWGGRTTGPVVKNIFQYIYHNLYKKSHVIS